jgi:hypothetical protein
MGCMPAFSYPAISTCKRDNDYLSIWTRCVAMDCCDTTNGSICFMIWILCTTGRHRDATLLDRFALTASTDVHSTCGGSTELQPANQTDKEVREKDEHLMSHELNACVGGSNWPTLVSNARIDVRFMTAFFSSLRLLCIEFAMPYVITM